MIEAVPAVNRAFSAGASGFPGFLGRCPRFATANRSCGGLWLNAAPLALNTYEARAIFFRACGAFRWLQFHLTQSYGITSFSPTVSFFGSRIFFLFASRISFQRLDDL